MEEIKREFAALKRYVNFTKVYLETYRGGLLIDRDRMMELKEYFLQQDIEVSGGITWTHDKESDNPLQGGFGTLC